MCLILISFKQHAGWPLLLAANRDEFFERPTQAAKFWDDNPSILAGRDLKLGGTWLGMDKSGRIAAVTNYHEPSESRTGLKSRGFLVSNYLIGNKSPEDYLHTISGEIAQYDGFNLFVGDMDSLHFYSSYTAQPVLLEPGIHGISNGNLDYPWPKVTKGKDDIRKILDSDLYAEPESYFKLLADRDIPDDSRPLGNGEEIVPERSLAPVFVQGEHYGTRSSSVILCQADGRILFSERSFDRNGDATGTAEYTIIPELNSG